MDSSLKSAGKRSRPSSNSSSPALKRCKKQAQQISAPSTSAANLILKNRSEMIKSATSDFISPSKSPDGAELERLTRYKSPSDSQDCSQLALLQAVERYLHHRNQNDEAFDLNGMCKGLNACWALDCFRGYYYRLDHLTKDALAQDLTNLPPHNFIEELFNDIIVLNARGEFDGGPETQQPLASVTGLSLEHLPPQCLDQDEFRDFLQKLMHPNTHIDMRTVDHNIGFFCYEDGQGRHVLWRDPNNLKGCEEIDCEEAL